RPSLVTSCRRRRSSRSSTLLKRPPWLSVRLVTLSCWWMLKVCRQSDSWLGQSLGWRGFGLTPALVLSSGCDGLLESRSFRLMAAPGNGSSYSKAQRSECRCGLPVEPPSLLHATLPMGWNFGSSTQPKVKDELFPESGLLMSLAEVPAEAFSGLTTA